MVCRQLGPVLHSPAAEMHGLKTSLLEAFVQFHATQSRQDADLGLAPCLGTPASFTQRCRLDTESCCPTAGQVVMIGPTTLH